MNKIVISCSCNANEHNLIFSVDEEEKELYINTFLENGTFFERVCKGLKYIFGYKGRYGDFSETILTEVEAKELKKIIEDFLKLAKK